jgi:hypothetical protein
MTTIIHANGKVRCSKGCGRKATYTIPWEDCGGEYYGYCGYCYRNESGTRHRISDISDIEMVE